MIYFYWLFGLAFAITLSVLLAVKDDPRDEA